MLLVDEPPELAKELQELFVEAGRAKLAAQIPALRIVDRCRCGDSFCTSFHTQPKANGRHGPGHDCLELEPTEGMLILDVVAGEIAHVRVLNRDGVGKRQATATEVQFRERSPRKSGASTSGYATYS